VQKSALLGSVSLKKAQAIADEIVRQGGDAIAIEADVLNRESLETAREVVIKRYGRVEHSRKRSRWQQKRGDDGT